MLEFFVELIVEVLIEGLLEGVWWVFGEDDGGGRFPPVEAAIGYLILGACLGGLSVWLLPTRLLPPAPIPGLSVVLNPLIAGTIMELWGRHRTAQGHLTSNLTTWYGGAALALGMSLVRFLGLGLG